jgi:hypothetical protein
VLFLKILVANLSFTRFATCVKIKFEVYEILIFLLSSLKIKISRERFWVRTTILNIKCNIFTNSVMSYDRLKKFYVSPVSTTRTDAYIATFMHDLMKTQLSCK